MPKLNPRDAGGAQKLFAHAEGLVSPGKIEFTLANGQVISWEQILGRYLQSIEGLGVSAYEIKPRLALMWRDFLVFRNVVERKKQGESFQSISRVLKVPARTISPWASGVKQPQSISEQRFKNDADNRKPLHLPQEVHQHFAYVLGSFMARPNFFERKAGRECHLGFSSVDLDEAQRFALELSRAMAPSDELSRAKSGVTFSKKTGTGRVPTIHLVGYDSSNLAKLLNLSSDYGARVPPALKAPLMASSAQSSLRGVLATPKSRKNFLQAVFDRQGLIIPGVRSVAVRLTLPNANLAKFVSKLLREHKIPPVFSSPKSGNFIHIRKNGVPVFVEKIGLTSREKSKRLSWTKRRV